MASASDCWFCAKAAAGNAAATAMAIGRIDRMITPLSVAVRRAKQERVHGVAISKRPLVSLAMGTEKRLQKDYLSPWQNCHNSNTNLALSLDKCLTIVQEGVEGERHAAAVRAGSMQHRARQRSYRRPRDGGVRRAPPRHQRARGKLARLRVAPEDR